MRARGVSDGGEGRRARALAGPAAARWAQPRRKRGEGERATRGERADAGAAAELGWAKNRIEENFLFFFLFQYFKAFSK
jgi:hypothetical protein